MKITCDACGSKYSIGDDKVRGKKVKVRCKGCQASILVDGTAIGEGGSSASDNEESSTTEASSSPVEAAPSATGASKPKPKLAAGMWSVNLSDDDSRDMSTDQLVAAWKSGEVTADAYVWKDGMADWTPIEEVAELKSKLEAAPAPPADDGVTTSAALPNKPVPGKPAPAKPLPGKPLPGRPGAPSPAKSAAKAPPKMDDLFGGIDFAGREEPAQAKASSAVDDKPKGTRNESSVLFSLDALKAGVEAEKPAEPSKPSDDPFGFGTAGGGGLGSFGTGFGANAADLLTAPVKEVPKPVVQATPRPAGTLAGPPSAEPKAKGKGLIIGAVVGVLALAGGAFAFMGGSKTDVQSSTASSASADSPKDDSEKKAMEEKLAKAEEEKKAMEAKLAKAEEEKKSAEAAPADSAKAPEEAKPADPAKPNEGKTAAADSGATKAEPAKTEPAKTEPAKTEAKPAAAAAPAAGSIDTAAAKAALAAAAGQVSSCAKKGGPTGPGRVQVTFAPSGRVTNAVVTGGAYGGTAVGGCIASTFRSARVPPFQGSSVTVAKSFNINN